ncbi:MAG TPA: dihydrofolate reductase [Steroidobacteraceae bacterium]|jgi:dihydrofolate reductase
MAPRIALVVAVADNGVIGRAGTLPWHLPDDLRFFKSVTMGKPMLMGRRTFESIGRPLPGRRNIVLTRGTPDLPAGVELVASLEAALALVAEAPELCVIGGATLYAQTLPQAQRLYLTRVHATVDGDVRFPPWIASDWRELERSEHPADARHAYAFSLLRLERQSSPR